MHVLRRLHHVYIWNKDIFINCKKKNRKERDRIIRLYLYKLYAVANYEMSSILDMYISHAILLPLSVNDALSTKCADPDRIKTGSKDRVLWSVEEAMAHPMADNR